MDAQCRQQQLRSRRIDRKRNRQMEWLGTCDYLPVLVLGGRHRCRFDWRRWRRPDTSFANKQVRLPKWLNNPQQSLPSTSMSVEHGECQICFAAVVNVAATVSTWANENETQFLGFL